VSDEVEVSSINGGVRINGPLTFGTVPGLVPLAKSWLELGDDSIEVDLAGVTHADSAGVALLLEWWSILQTNHRRLRYTNVPEQVDRFIRINGLDTTLLA
jgi:phospholipid transport system transporter-binding protein